MTLDQFETLVQTQKPASEPWRPVSDYSFEARKAIEGQHPQLIKDVFQPEFVIDAGCGPEGVLVKLLLELEVPVLGFDPQIPKQSINPALVHGSLIDSRFGNDDDEPFADLVVCREVLEHLTIAHIRAAVRNLCRMTTKYVYVTTRFHPQPCGLLDVATVDLLDPTHITMLNQDLLRLLFVLEGFTRCRELEARMDWMQKGRVLVYQRHN